MDELKKLMEEQGRAFEAFKAANDARLAAIEAKGYAPADVEAKVDTINAEITRIGQEIKDLTIASQRPQPGGGTDPETVRDHKRAMFGMGGYMRKGNVAELDRIQNTLRSSSDPDGGYFLPEATVGPIVELVNQINAMRTLASVDTCGGGGWKTAAVTSEAGGGWMGETTTISASDTPAIAEVNITPGTGYSLLAAYNQVLEDADRDLEAWLVSEGGRKLANLEATGFVTGDGVNSPRGIAAYPFVANASYAWGKVGYVVSGKSAAFADTNPADYLLNLQHALKVDYRRNGNWLMNDATLLAVRKFQDGQGNYLWQPGLQLNVPDSILGKPVAIDDSVADIASNSYSIFFGDFKAAYQIVDRRGITLLRNPFLGMLSNLTYFLLTKRVGGGIKDFAAIKAMKFST